MNLNTNVIFIKFIIVSAIILTINVCKSASFDCSKAEISVEKIICADKELSSLDSKLGNLYKEKKANNPNIGSRQREWLQGVRNICSSTECLKSAYLRRISEIEHDAACPVDLDKLLGTWVKIKGEAFEEMSLINENGEHRFISWLHHNPELSGVWSLEKCVINVRGESDSRISFDFKIEGYSGKLLQLKDVDEGSVSVFQHQ
jgi:hypothetical protein